MKYPLFLIFGIALMANSGQSQTRSRVFDNFDLTAGVTIVRPTVAETPAVKSKSRNKLVKKTAQTMSVQEGLGSTMVVGPVFKLAMGTGSGLNGFTTGILEYDGYIVESAKRYRVDPLLIYAQMHQESSFKLRATSNKGASGLMQLMPGTARRFGVTDIYDPKQNIDAGVRYM